MLDINQAIKIMNYDTVIPPSNEELMEAGEVFFKKLFNVDVRNPDGSFKSMYDVFKEASDNYKNIMSERSAQNFSK